MARPDTRKRTAPFLRCALSLTPVAAGHCSHTASQPRERTPSPSPKGPFKWPPLPYDNADRDAHSGVRLPLPASLAPEPLPSLGSAPCMRMVDGRSLPHSACASHRACYDSASRPMR
ncbi:hypothetical protein C8J57DRAFT_1337203 [Mycena rebaudengoi]|nr:hypothetical protein C8J57DRAFT_1337203 [Mycena rebaudengoi]